MSSKRHYNTDGLVVYASITAHLISQRRSWVSVAREAGVSEEWLYVVRFRRSPAVECVQAVATALGVPPWTLLWPESAHQGVGPETAEHVTPE